jgi:hypothetical protein
VIVSFGDVLTIFCIDYTVTVIDSNVHPVSDEDDDDGIKQYVKSKFSFPEDETLLGC